MKYIGTSSFVKDSLARNPRNQCEALSDPLGRGERHFNTKLK